MARRVSISTVRLSQQRLRQAADLALGLARLAVLQPFGQDGQRLTKTTRGDARLVNTGVLAGDRGSELPVQRTGAAFQ